MMRSNFAFTLTLMICVSLGCGGTNSPPPNSSTSKTETSSPNAPKTFAMPPAPEGTRLVAGSNFQIFVPTSWSTETPTDSPYSVLNGTMNADNGAATAMAGTLGVGKYPSDGKSIQQLAEDRLTVMKTADDGNVVHVENNPITLANGESAQFTIFEFESPESSTRRLFFDVFARADGTSHWFASFHVAGDSANEQIKRDGAIGKLLAQCVRSFVPVAPAR